jgi:hypothetical protein
MYFVNEVLHEAKTRYLVAQKLLYAVLIATRKLHHYFQAHKILMVTSYPLRSIHHNLNAIGNFVKWATELTEFELEFAPRHTIKSQVLADFMAEWTPSTTSPEDAA